MYQHLVYQGQSFITKNTAQKGMEELSSKMIEQEICLQPGKEKTEGQLGAKMMER